jgi:hypothetical protein
MKIIVREPPRTFTVGKVLRVEIKDMGDVYLAPDEQLTFVTESGCRHDFVRKDWGFYATPSINGRLANEGFKTALVENKEGRIYLMVVEKCRMDQFDRYCKTGGQRVLSWLDEHPLAQEDGRS